MKVGSLNRLLRFQLNSFVSTLVDFTITIVLTEIAGFWYLISTSIGTITGGAANFIIARHWVFRVREFPALKQLGLYLINWCCSSLLNITSVFLMTSLMHLNYIVSKMITAVLVGLLFNYNFQRKFVFSMPQHNSQITKRVNK